MNTEKKALRKTALWNWHQEHQARLVDFAGYEMPVNYEHGTIQEHLWVRKNCGLFDVSHMGALVLRGENVLDEANKVFTRDLSSLEIGDGAYTLLLNEAGNCLDDLILYRTGQQELTCIFNASNKKKILTPLDEHFAPLKIDVKILYNDFAIIAVQGPESEGILKKAFQFDLSKTKPFQSTLLNVAGTKALAMCSGYTGEKGCEILIPNTHAEALWKHLMKLSDGKAQAIGLGARNTLRLEMGYSLYGHEIDETINPIEAGLKWACGMKKEKFWGKEALENYLLDPQRKLVSLCHNSRRAPRQGMKVLNEADQQVGSISSGTYAPSLEKAIGMALVHKNEKGPFFVEIRNKKIPFEKTKRPFYKGNIQ